jgi:alpha-tubulin suppressor-like RCC1 family protein
VVVAKTNGTTILTARVGALMDTTTVTVQQRPARLAFLTRPGSQLQGRVIGPAVEVAVNDARGVRLTVPSAPIELSIAGGGLAGTTVRGTTEGVARFDDIVASEPARAAQFTARLGDLSAASIFFEVQLALASISAGGAHACGLTAAGRAYCWGYQGCTGDGGTTARTTPVRVSGTGTYHTLHAGSSTTWALAQSGGVVTWGSTPTAFASTQSFTSLAANWFTCGITAEQFAYCWGTSTTYFGSDSLLDGSPATAPTTAMRGRKVLAIASGIAHTCVIAAAESSAWCAGNNPHGELGNGTTSFAVTPVAVAGGLKFTALSAGNEFTCGIATTGDTYCWGRNDQGQLGDPGETAAQSTLPRLVAGGLRFRTVSARGTHTCGLTDDGTAYCWGSNSHGMLGNAGLTAASSATPLPVSGGLRFDVVSAGGFHTCGIATTGLSYCWGDWSNGAIGTGSPNTNGGPVLIASPAP